MTAVDLHDIDECGDDCVRCAAEDAFFDDDADHGPGCDGPLNCTCGGPVRTVALNRAETDACEVGTVGCCIDHDDSSISQGCETW